MFNQGSHATSISLFGGPIPPSQQLNNMSNLTMGQHGQHGQHGQFAGALMGGGRPMSQPVNESSQQNIPTSRSTAFGQIQMQESSQYGNNNTMTNQGQGNQQQNSGRPRNRRERRKAALGNDVTEPGFAGQQSQYDILPTTPTGLEAPSATAGFMQLMQAASTKLSQDSQGSAGNQQMQDNISLSMQQDQSFWPPQNQPRLHQIQNQSSGTLPGTGMSNMHSLGKNHPGGIPVQQQQTHGLMDPQSGVSSFHGTNLPYGAPKQFDSHPAQKPEPLVVKSDPVHCDICDVSFSTDKVPLKINFQA